MAFFISKLWNVNKCSNENADLLPLDAAFKVKVKKKIPVLLKGLQRHTFAFTFSASPVKLPSHTLDIS